MLANLGDFLYRRRMVALCITMAVVIGATIFGLGLFSSLSNASFEAENSESSQAAQLLQTKLNDSGTDVILLLRSDTDSATDPNFMLAATSLFSKLKKRPEVASITDYYSTRSPNFISRDGYETFAVLRLKGQDTTTKQNEYTSLQPSLTSPTLQVTTGGTIPANVALTEQATHDLEQAEAITLPIILLLLLVIFGGVIAASLPLFIGIIAALLTFAALRGFTFVTDVSIYALNVVTVLGLGLAIDYSLFILSRFREELNSNGQDVRTALERTMATAGRTVIFSALTVSTSLLSLLLFPMNIMRSIGLGAISAVLMAMLLSITFLPLVLALLGPRVNALSLRRFIRFRKSPMTNTNIGEEQGIWYRLSEMTTRRPVIVTIITALLLVTLLIPFFHIKLATSGINLLPADSEARVVSQRLSQDFAQQGNAQLTIAVTTPGNALSPENLASLGSYVKSVQAIPGVVQVQSLVTVDPNINLSTYQQLYAHPGLNPQIDQVATNLAKDDFTEITVAIQPADHTDEATTLVNQIRALQAPDSMTAQVTGITPIEIDILASINAALPAALLVIFVSIFALLFLMTGSLVVPIKAIILNMLSLSATFGGLVWIFQDGHLQDIFHFQSQGNIDATLPVIIFALAFGLSMDYEVFVLSRIKERFDETGNNRQAVASGIQSTGWIVSSAALLLAVVEGGFGWAKTLSVQEVGIGIAIAVMMDALVIRTLLLPATMHLLGKANWWAPAPLRWLWQHIGLKETAPTLAPAFHVQAGSGEPLPLRDTIAFHAQADRDESWGQAPPLHPLRMGNEILTDKQDSTKREASLVESSPLLLVDGRKVALQHGVISTQTANGEEIMGPGILLWRYPEKNIVNGSLLSVASNQFCVLKSGGTILKVYETGQHRVQTPDDILFNSPQLTFDGEPIPLEYEALYINRAQLVSAVSDVALLHEGTRVDYSVDYSIHVATREDAVRLVQHMANQSHPLGPVGSGLAPDQGLHIRDINASVDPMIKQTVNQLVQITLLHPVGAIETWTGVSSVPTELSTASDQGLQMQEISQLAKEQLQQSLSTYGMTVDKVKVRVVPRDEGMKAPPSLEDFGLSKLDTTSQYAAMTKNSTEYHLTQQNEEMPQNMYMALQNRLNRYADEIAAIQTELESTRADFSLRMETHSARLQELSRLINSDLRPSAPDLDIGETTLEPAAPLESQISSGTTGPFRMSLSARDR
jgi:RND superfamily putative drug exporter